MLLRKRALVLCCVLSLGGFCSAGLAQAVTLTSSGQGAVEEAEQASAAWLKIMDSGEYGQSWTVAAAAVQSAVTEEKWLAAMKSVREPLGKIVSRTIQSATRTSTLPGAADGDYVVLVHESRFEHKQTAQETVVMSLERDKIWRVSGYFIK